MGEMAAAKALEQDLGASGCLGSVFPIAHELSDNAAKLSQARAPGSAPICPARRTRASAPPMSLLACGWWSTAATYASVQVFEMPADDDRLHARAPAPNRTII